MDAEDACEQLKAATIGMDEAELTDLLEQDGRSQDPAALAAYLAAPEMDDADGGDAADELEEEPVE